MKKKITLLFTCIILTLVAQTKTEKDKKAIKAMSGCYSVKFNFCETFNNSKDSLYRPSKVKQVGATELALVIYEDDTTIQIQHLLVIPMGDDQEPMVMKHWRQDWIHENKDIYEFDKDNQWNYKQLSANEVEGQWTQKVYQVDDSPRYEGSSSWVHVDGKSYWENTTSAPLPRRENTKRRDYNVTLRRNRQEITKNGWLHDQNNDKIVRKTGVKDFVLAQEKGINLYQKIEPKKCAIAKKWWKENEGFWTTVRSTWSTRFKTNTTLQLHKKVNKKKLYSLLFKMDAKKSKKEEIEKTVNKFIKE